MSYTLINWDELTPINPANLNKMDNAIDSNENRVGTAETNINSNDSAIAGNDSDIATLDSRVDGNDSEINQIDSNHDGIVDNADSLNGKHWVTIASGSKSQTGFYSVNLKSVGSHHHYNISVYCNNHRIGYSIPFSNADAYTYAYIETNYYNNGYDALRVYTPESLTTHYEVWSWE